MKDLETKIRETVPTLVVFEHADVQNAIDIKNLIQELRANYGDRINIEHIDCSHNGKWKVAYKLEEYPTWILFKEGQELMRLSGKKNPAELNDMVQRAL